VTDLTLNEPLDNYQVVNLGQGSSGPWAIDPMGGHHPEYPRIKIILAQAGKAWEAWEARLEITHPKGTAETPERAVLDLMNCLDTFRGQIMAFIRDVQDAAKDAAINRLKVFGHSYESCGPTGKLFHYHGTDPNMPQEITKDSSGWWVSRDNQFRSDGARFPTPEAAVKDYMSRLADKVKKSLEDLK
jgi:hypothetical protein